MRKAAAEGIRRQGREERGVALLIVLVIVALLAALVVDFGYSSRVDLTLADLYENSQKARTIVKSGFYFGRALLLADTNGYDGPKDLWTRTDLISFVPMFLEEGEAIRGSITDENSKFNLNSLVNSRGKVEELSYAQFQRLLTVLNIDTGLADAVVDWIDPDDKTMPMGAERNYYLSEGRTCKNAPLDSIAELLLVKGFTRDLLWGTRTSKGLIDYVTCLSDGKININTASEEVLRSLDDEMDQALAQSIIARRNEQPFETTNDMRDMQSMPALLFSRILSRITVSSNYFSIRMEGNVNKASVRLDAVVKRSGQNVTPLYWRLQ